jgi:MSHA biogenesis protein MshP
MRRNAGMSLVMAIFILVILAALAGFIVSMATTQQTDFGVDLEGSRAYHAARAGLDYGAYQAVTNSSCVNGSINLALPAASFNDFTSVRVTFVNSPNHDEAGTLKTICTITANACNQPAAGVCPNPAPGANYVERELQLTVINPP